MAAVRCKSFGALIFLFPTSDQHTIHAIHFSHTVYPSQQKTEKEEETMKYQNYLLKFI